MKIANSNLLLISALIATGCGGGSFRENIKSSGSTGANTQTTTTSGTFIPSPAFSFPIHRIGPSISSAKSSSNSANWVPAANDCGSNCLKYSVDTATKLRVRVKAIDGNAYIKDSLTTFPSQYGCVSYQIYVGNQMVQTPLLKVPGASANATAQCSGSASEYIADMSYGLGVSTNGSFEIRIQNPQYDLYCNYYSGGSYNGMKCPSTPLYQNNSIAPYSWHEVKIQVDAETNGTGF
ncbi:MAG: hypothetical protein KA715_06185 [Xanthomonadaceae bacterium]|nr:hypothetical protein [Xanthomonadaceae bacterium]